MSRRLGAIALYMLFVAVGSAQASPITILVGDKDWFGSPATAGGPAPWSGNPGALYDGRSAAEKAAATGAHLTDLYSALYLYGADSGCDPLADPGCTPNGALGTVVFAFSGILQSASLTMLMGDFECSLWLAMAVDVNGVSLPFCFDDGFQGTVTRTLALTPAMIAAANLVGEIRLRFDHTGAYETPDTPASGSFDYIAFDYFEMNGEVANVPEPATLTLLALGALTLAARRRMRRS